MVLLNADVARDYLEKVAYLLLVFAIADTTVSCVEGAMHHDCPVCLEYLFESRDDVTIMPCGHTIHKICLKEMREHYQYACPLCSKSVCDMSNAWERLDMEIAAT